MFKILLTGSPVSTGKVVREHLEGLGYEVINIGDSSECEVVCDFGSSRFNSNQSDRVIKAAVRMGDTPPIALVNLAGITIMNKIDQVNSDDWDYLMRINLKAPFMLGQSFLDIQPDYEKTNNPVIVNIASMGYKIPLRHSTSYCASKAGLVAITKQMAKEMGKKAKIIAVAPGSIENSNMIEQVINIMMQLRSISKKEATDYVKNGTPLGRMQTMEEVARMVQMAIEAPDYMTGAVMEAPGGAI